MPKYHCGRQGWCSAAKPVDQDIDIQVWGLLPVLRSMIMNSKDACIYHAFRTKCVFHVPLRPSYGSDNHLRQSENISKIAAYQIY